MKTPSKAQIMEVLRTFKKIEQEEAWNEIIYVKVEDTRALDLVFTANTIKRIMDGKMDF